LVTTGALYGVAILLAATDLRPVRALRPRGSDHSPG
jgi:hypothetical protein